MSIEFYANLFLDNLPIFLFIIVCLSLFLNVYFRGKKMDKLKFIAQELGLKFSKGGAIQGSDFNNQIGQNAEQNIAKAQNVLSFLNMVGNLTGIWSMKGTMNQVLIDVFPHRVSKNNHYTAFRAHLSKPYDFKFEVTKENIMLKLLSGVGILQDIKTGTPEIDSDFLIKGEDENKVKLLFSNPSLGSALRDLVSQYGNARMVFTNEYLELQFTKVNFEIETFREIISRLTEKVKLLQS